jgi:hypothetical protein
LISSQQLADSGSQSKSDKMNAPIPANDTRPLVPGDRVRILPEFQDEGDDGFERIVVEAPPESPRVLIKTMIPGFQYPPTERIEARMLTRVVQE